MGVVEGGTFETLPWVEPNVHKKQKPRKFQGFSSCAGLNRSISELGIPYEFVVPKPPDKRHTPELWQVRKPRARAT